MDPPKRCIINFYTGKMTSELMFIIDFYVTNIENIKGLEYNGSVKL